jgi:hypothetical protein
MVPRRPADCAGVEDSDWGKAGHPTADDALPRGWRTTLLQRHHFRLHQRRECFQQPELFRRQLARLAVDQAQGTDGLAVPAADRHTGVKARR